MRRLAHHQIERSRLDLSKPAISIKRDRDRYGRIISLESHAARDEQIVKLINMKRLACLSQQQCACLRDGAIAEPMTDRLDVVSDRRDAAMIQIRNRTGRPMRCRVS